MHARPSGSHKPLAIKPSIMPNGQNYIHRRQRKLLKQLHHWGLFIWLIIEMQHIYIIFLFFWQRHMSYMWIAHITFNGLWAINLLVGFCRAQPKTMSVYPHNARRQRVTPNGTHGKEKKPRDNSLFDTRKIVHFIFFALKFCSLFDTKLNFGSSYDIVACSSNQLESLQLM